jgi:arsenate reductase-like glutaredoxin family protein
MTTLEINTKEIEIFKTIPKEELQEFIEKNGAKLREILEEEAKHYTGYRKPK